MSPQMMPYEPSGDELGDPSSSDDNAYIRLPLFRAPTNICFAYLHNGNTLREIFTNITY